MIRLDEEDTLDRPERLNQIDDSGSLVEDGGYSEQYSESSDDLGCTIQSEYFP